MGNVVASPFRGVAMRTTKAAQSRCGLARLSLVSASARASGASAARRLTASSALRASARRRRSSRSRATPPWAAEAALRARRRVWRVRRARAKRRRRLAQTHAFFDEPVELARRLGQRRDRLGERIGRGTGRRAVAFAGEAAGVCASAGISCATGRAAKERFSTAPFFTTSNVASGRQGRSTSDISCGSAV